MPKLSAVIPCKNSEATIGDCLESVMWADEILVVDSGSTDRTPEIAREYTDRVLEHHYESYAAQCTWAVARARHPWVLVLDSDERATPELQGEIRALMGSAPGCDGYRITRRNWFLGTQIRHCGWDRDRVLRLFRREAGRYQDRRVHPRVEVRGRVGRLRGKLDHRPYASLDDYLEKLGRYTTWSARDLLRSGRRPTLVHLGLRPLARFLKMYLLRQGFRDGRAGLVLCTLAAFSVSTKYAKAWAMGRGEHGG